MAIPNIQDILDKRQTSPGGQSTLESLENAPTPSPEETQLANNDVISSESLGSAPDFQVTEPKTPVLTESFSAQLESIPDTFAEKVSKQRETTEKGATDSLTEYVNAMASQSSFEELSLAAEDNVELQTLESDLLDINDQIRREQLGMRRAIERIQEKGGGLKSGAAAEISNIRRESLAKQADLAIVQMAAQGRYDSAKTIADRQAKVMFEQQQNELDARKFMYQENKSLFTQAEQREFDLQLSDRERELEQERADFETLQATKLQALQMAQMNGAPVSIMSSIQNAQTPEEVIQVGGQWGSVDMLERQYRRQQIASSRTNQLLALAAAGDRNAIETLGFDPSEKPEKLDSTTKRQAQDSYNASNDLLRLATEYKNIVDTKGYTNEIFGDKGTVGRIKSLRAQMTAAYKDAKKLGTLDQGLLTLMDQVLGDQPTSSLIGRGPEGNIFSNITGGRADKISSSMQELINQTQLENARNAHLLGKEPWSNPLDLELDKDTQVNQAMQTSTNPLGI